MLKNEKVCVFNFELTTYCNAGCPTCFRTRFLDLLPKPYKHLTTETFSTFILNNVEFFKRNAYDRLIAKFCGEIGDPLMNPHLNELTSIAENVFDRVDIYTNGGLKSSKWIRNFLVSYKKAKFVFGIDGLSDETNQIYRINVNTNKALENMFMASKYRETRWDHTIFEHNHHELLDVIQLAKKHHLDLLCRFNGREFKKIKNEDLLRCEILLKETGIKYTICR